MRWLLFLGAVCLAGIALVQSLSNVYSRAAPFAVVQLSPFDTPAADRAAKLEFLSGNRESAESFARIALEDEPLSPDAIAVLAQTAATASAKKQIVVQGAAVSKRNTLLLGTIIEQAAIDGDLERNLVALDRTLRVHPDLAGQVLPSLVGLLNREGGVDAFARILQREPVWTDRFLRVAARNDATLLPVLELRRKLPNSVSIENATDSIIMTELVNAGRLSDALRIYRRLAKGRKDVADRAAGTLGWETRYPPFDWKLSDEPGESARINRRNGTMTIAFRRGRGGDVAERLIFSDKPIRAIQIAHDFRLQEASSVEVRLQCAGDRSDILVQSEFAASPTIIRIPRTTPTCQLMKIVLGGRSWSTGANVRGKIEAISLLN